MIDSIRFGLIGERCYWMKGYSLASQHLRQGEWEEKGREKMEEEEVRIKKKKATPPGVVSFPIFPADRGAI